MVRSQRLIEHCQSLNLRGFIITDLRNGFYEVRWISAVRGNRQYYRSVCARSIGGMIARLSQAAS